MVTKWESRQCRSACVALNLAASHQLHERKLHGRDLREEILNVRALVSDRSQFHFEPVQIIGQMDLTPQPTVVLHKKRFVQHVLLIV